MFKRVAMLAVLSICAGFLYAQQTVVDMSDVPPEKRQEILKVIEQNKSPESKAKETFSPENVSKYVAIGKEIAELIPIFAEKTGIAADKVLNSFTGKVLLTIVLFKVFAKTIFGILLLALGPLIWWRWFKHMFLLTSYEVKEHPNKLLAFFGKKQVVKTFSSFKSLTSYGSLTESTATLLAITVVILACILAAGIGLILT